MGENSAIEFRYAKRSANRLGISLYEFVNLRNSGKKWCSRCRDWHPISEFGVDRQKTDGLLMFCRASTHRVIRKPHRGGNPLGTRLSEQTKARMRAAHTGSANANWKGGITPAIRRARQHALYQRWRRAVIARDRGVCQKCWATPKSPHAHHIKPFKTHPHLVLDVGNGMTVCAPCHRSIHNGERDGRK